MATAVNPKILNMNSVELQKVEVGTAVTGRKGTPIVLTSGQAVIAADDEVPYGCLAEDITTAKTAGDKIPIFRWNVGTRLEIYVCTNGTPGAIGTTNLGKCYDLEMIGTAPNEVAYLDLGAASDLCFRVIDLAQNYEPAKHAAADSPGLCVVEVMKVQSA